MDHTRSAACFALVHARMADHEQTPMQSIMDGDDEKILGEDIHPLRSAAYVLIGEDATSGGSCSGI